MKKVSKPFTRKGRKGYWVRWFEAGKKHLKHFNTIYEARIWSRKKYIDLNMDVYGAVNMPWEYAVREYLNQYDIKGFEASSKYITERVLLDFEQFCHPQTVADISQRAVDNYIKYRIGKVKSRYTVNKDIGRLKAFINWLYKRNYHPGRIDISLMKTVPVIRKALTNEEIKQLLRACPTECWRIRLLLSLATGLRKGDVDSLKVNQLNLKLATLDITAQKTGKVSLGRPIPSSLMPTLTGYVESLTGASDDTRLLPDKNVRKNWEEIRRTAGLPQATRQQLRVTFSTLIQKLSGLETAKNLLQHSDSRTTNDFYSDQQLLLFWKIQQLNPIVEDWLKAI